MARLLAAMSGGVDSSVATALAVRDGHEVVGATLKQWEFGDEDVRLVKGCNTLDATDDARRAAEIIGVAHYTFDFREVFSHEVVDPFVSDYASGLTPNPCVRCNERVRFGALLDKALRLGFDGLITGHYARISDGRLLRAKDLAKDQSYVLYAIGLRGVKHARFPLGEMRAKNDVRELARSFGLPNADRADSLEVCFVGDGRRPGDVVAERVPVAVRRGPIVDEQGNTVGEHRGLAYYTVGQRKGLGGGSASPRYVREIDPDRNVLVVSGAEGLSTDRLAAGRPRFINEPPAAGEIVDAVVRYRGDPAPARFEPAADGFGLELLEPLRAVSAGQAVVLYRGDEVLGGGTIVRPGR